MGELPVQCEICHNEVVMCKPIKNGSWGLGAMPEENCNHFCINWDEERATIYFHDL